ncbi:MAG: succinate dehydrogenase assembly factor 2 [Methylococcales bacterium]
MTNLNKLRWRCRRGTKELDFMLQRYLDNGYLQADSWEQTQFAQLLEMEDDFLLGILLADLDARELSGLVDKIKA